jgi:hypothetical protein
MNNLATQEFVAWADRSEAQQFILAAQHSLDISASSS